jgi:biopolymer transport protein ExbD
MARIVWTRRASSIALCAFSFLGLSSCSRRDSDSGNQKPLDVQVLRDGSIALDGKRYETVKDFQAFLRERRPPTVYVRPAKDASYKDVARTMTAIQEVGGIRVGIVGNEKF